MSEPVASSVSVSAGPAGTSSPLRDAVLYEVTAQVGGQTEQIRWMLFNNYLLANSILLLAWAAIFAAAPRGYQTFVALELFAVAGLLVSAVWSMFGRRSTYYSQAQSELARRLEERSSRQSLASFSTAERRRVSIPAPIRWTTSTVVVVGIPLFFVAVYFAIGVIVVHHDL